jgi:hypothetical protein
MADKDLWVTFEKTGNILDYLQYKGLQVGEDKVESGSQSDGNDTVRNTDW